MILMECRCKWYILALNIGIQFSIFMAFLFRPDSGVSASVSFCYSESVFKSCPAGMIWMQHLFCYSQLHYRRVIYVMILTLIM